MSTIKTAFIYLILPATLAFSLFLLFSAAQKENIEMAPEKVKIKYMPAPAVEEKNIEKIILAVPYVSEAPEGIWEQPWVNACEEATIMMIDEYYKDKKEVGIAEAKSYLQDLFLKEDILFGTNRNADSAQIMEIVTGHTSFSGIIKRNPTIEEIKKEIIEGRPVLSLHRGFDLKNPNIEFSPTLSSYHTLVVIGYDDEKGVFIAHDPGDEIYGERHWYSYDVFMNSLHDYDKERNKADGVPTVIFTSKKG